MDVWMEWGRLLFIVVCFFAGYFVIGRLFDRRRKARPAPLSPAAASASAGPLEPEVLPPGPSGAPDFTPYLDLFALLGLMAAADGKVTAAKTAVIGHFVSDVLRAGSLKLDQLADLLHAAARSGEPFEAYVRRFYEGHRDQPVFLRQVLGVLRQIALSDGVFGPEEHRLMETAAGLFGMEAA